MSQCQAQWEILLALVQLLLPHLPCHLLILPCLISMTLTLISALEPDLDPDDPPFIPDPVDDSEPDVLGSPPPSLPHLI